MGTKIGLAAAAMVVLAGIGIAMWQFCIFIGRMPLGRSFRPSAPQVSAKAPDDTAVVLNFRASGDKDAKFYAIGFARALSDLLLCAPKSLIQQPSSQDLGDHMNSVRAKPDDAIPDSLAKILAARMGVKYAVTGDLELKGGQVTVTLYVLDVSSESKAPPATLSRSGKLSDLPQMQVALARDLLAAVKLPKPGSAPANLAQANFSSSETLALYARSCLAKTYAEAEQLRWQAWEKDRQSLFAAFRLIEFYVYGTASCGDIMAKSRLAEVIETARKRNEDNTYLDVVSGMLLAKECRYREAQGILEAALRRDPGMARAHDALAYTACCRLDVDLAMREAEKVVSIWPSHPYSHLRMSDAHKLAADQARQGRYFGAMSRSARAAWDSHSQEGFREVQAAVSIDPDCSWGWRNMLVFARELSCDKERDTAFKELIRINPRDIDAYDSYAFCFSPQWGGASGRQEDIFHQAEQVFGAGSAEMCVLRGWAMSSNSGRVEHLEEILRLADQAAGKTKDPGLRDRAMRLKCSTLTALRRHPEVLQVAQKEFAKNPNLDWRMRLAKGYQHRWEDSQDRAALYKAAELLKVYVAEIPFSPNGHIQYGWCLSRQGNPDAARKEFEAALKIDPQNETAQAKMKYVQ